MLWIPATRGTLSLGAPSPLDGGIAAFRKCAFVPLPIAPSRASSVAPFREPRTGAVAGLAASGSLRLASSKRRATSGAFGVAGTRTMVGAPTGERGSAAIGPTPMAGVLVQGSVALGADDCMGGVGSMLRIRPTNSRSRASGSASTISGTSALTDSATRTSAGATAAAWGSQAVHSLTPGAISRPHSGHIQWNMSPLYTESAL